MAILIQDKVVSSASRAKKFRDNMAHKGFKRVQRWVLDLDNVKVQEMLKLDLSNYKENDESEQWNEFALSQLEDITEKW